MFDEIEYKILKNHKKDILDEFVKINVINARVILQVLNNINEWSIQNNNHLTEKWVKIFVLVNTNYILNHYTFKAELMENLFLHLGENENPLKLVLKYISHKIKKYNQNFATLICQDMKIDKKSYYMNTVYGTSDEDEQDYTDKLNEIINFIEKNSNLINSLNFLYSLEIESYFDSHNKAELSVFDNINSFIESGVCKKTL